MRAAPSRPALAVALALTLAAALAGTIAFAEPVLDPLPGAEPLPADKQSAIRSEIGKPREPLRTKHVRSDGTPKYTNRLFTETSPYLRQHAHNPVNWYPWSDEAFADARRLGRPVLLSIGYSTCHWCHVMEHESFEDEEIARFLNERYIAIKVDREERPDLDSIYMTAVTLATGGGGWPMTVWLTPERKPFYAGTYYPARDGDRTGMPGFLTVLKAIDESYRSKSAEVAGAADELAARIKSRLSAASPQASSAVPVAADVFDAAMAAVRTRYDAENGGTRGGRKFPSGLPLRALLRYSRRSGDPEAMQMVTNTLEHMARGGIRDHLAGGFHRYSVDPEWIVPHFEKMLYDNALLAVAYTEAWQATGNAAFADVAREIVAWARREMTAPDGTFYSATDADTRTPGGELVEGWFFSWTPAEIEAALGADDARLFGAAYGVVADGPLEGRSVLHRVKSSGDLAAELSLPAADIDATLARSRTKLVEVRGARPAPLRDEKILTTWNALMVSAAAKVGSAFGDADTLSMARRAADRLLADWSSTRRLVHSRFGERTQPESFLEDYAFLEAALLDLFEAGDGPHRLDQAIALDAAVQKEFEDPTGGFFVTRAGLGDLLVREKSVFDGVEPSGSSVAILNLLRLAEWTGEAGYRERADRALASLAPALAAAPLALADALVALDYASDAPKEIVLVAPADPPGQIQKALAPFEAVLAPFEAVLAKTFVPNRIVVRLGAGLPASKLPVAEGKIAIDGRPTAYVCEARVCKLPARDAETFAAQIRAVRGLRPAPAVSP